MYSTWWDQLLPKNYGKTIWSCFPFLVLLRLCNSLGRLKPGHCSLWLSPLPMKTESRCFLTSQTTKRQMVISSLCHAKTEWKIQKQVNICWKQTMCPIPFLPFLIFQSHSFFKWDPSQLLPPFVKHALISPAGSHFFFLWNITALCVYCIKTFSISSINICYLVTCLMFLARFKLFKDGFCICFPFVFCITLSTEFQFTVSELMEDKLKVN